MRWGSRSNVAYNRNYITRNAILIHHNFHVLFQWWQQYRRGILSPHTSLVNSWFYVSYPILKKIAHIIQSCHKHQYLYLNFFLLRQSTITQLLPPHNQQVSNFIIRFLWLYAKVCCYTINFQLQTYHLDQHIRFAATPTPDVCGADCNSTIVIDPSTLDQIYSWQSSGWGVANYPDDCTCTLTVEVRSLWMIKFEME